MTLLALLFLAANVSVGVLFLRRALPFLRGRDALPTFLLGITTIALMPLLAPSISTILALLLFFSALNTLLATLIAYADSQLA